MPRPRAAQPGSTLPRLLVSARPFLRTAVREHLALIFFEAQCVGQGSDRRPCCATFLPELQVAGRGVFKPRIWLAQTRNVIIYPTTWSSCAFVCVCSRPLSMQRNAGDPARRQRLGRGGRLPASIRRHSRALARRKCFRRPRRPVRTTQIQHASVCGGRGYRVAGHEPR